jgi:hypothetical protein
VSNARGNFIATTADGLFQMKIFDRADGRFFNRLLTLGAVLVATAEPAMAQAYTYDEPVCGAVYRDEPSKPQQLRVVWEMSAGQKCVEQSNFPAACRHFKAAISTAERLPPEPGESSDLKTFLKTMIKTNGCQ